MSAGWVNLKQKTSHLRAIEKHYREMGYSDGYALKPAMSVNAWYSAGWTRGRQARTDFDNGRA